MEDYIINKAKELVGGSTRFTEGMLWLLDHGFEMVTGPESYDYSDGTVGHAFLRAFSTDYGSFHMAVWMKNGLWNAVARNFHMNYLRVGFNEPASKTFLGDSQEETVLNCLGNFLNESSLLAGMHNSDDNGMQGD